METYQNIMELLVKDEAKQQLQSLPPWIAASIKLDDLVTYALNRLPPLYASSKEGLEYQMHRGKSQFGDRISETVNLAIATIQKSPQRPHPTPLPPSRRSEPHQEALRRLKTMLHNHAIDWKTLPTAVELALVKASRKGIANLQDRLHAEPNRVPAGALPKSKRLRKTEGQQVGWNSSFYQL